MRYFYEEGYFAYLNGLDAAQNPYPPLSDESDKWIEGWIDADFFADS